MQFLLFLLIAAGLLLVCRASIGFAPTVRSKNVKSLKPLHGLDKLAYTLANPIAKLIRLCPDTEEYLKEMLADRVAPLLPCLADPRFLTNKRSLGSVLAAPIPRKP